MKKATIRWIWIVSVYLVCTVGLFFWMYSMFNTINISPSGYSNNAWFANLFGLFINNVAMSFLLVILWNILYSSRLLGSRYIGHSVYVLMFLGLLLHLAAGVGLLLMAVMPILSTVGGAEIFLQLLMAWSAGYGGDFVFMHCIPMLMIVPFFLSITLFAPEYIAHKFRLFNKLRQKIGLKYSGN